MSMKRTALHSIVQANTFLGGANKTKSTRLKVGKDFVKFSSDSGRPLSDLRHATFNQVKAYVDHYQKLGVKTATLNNKVASLRALLAARGVDLIQTGIADSKALGLKSRNRDGTKLPVTDEVFEAAVQSALEINEVGLVHVLKLERYLGVRGLEAIMSTHQLKIYARDALKIQDECWKKVQIKDGTKGGRPRFVQPIRAYANETFEVIKAAVEFAVSNGGFFIQGAPGTGLKEARARYHRLCAKVGLKGQYSPHSLRYRYATDKLIELYVEGMPLNEALSVVSDSLGHGITRRTFVRQVYAATVIGSLPASTSKEDIAALLIELNAMSVKLT